MRTALICACFLVLAVLSSQAKPQEQEVGRAKAAREAAPVPERKKRKLTPRLKRKLTPRLKRKLILKKKMILKKNAAKVHPQSRAIVVKGNTCEYITLADIPSNTGCGNGNKFVLKGATGVRKQFLIMNNKALLAFVTKKTKFTACEAFTDITTNVKCKEVSGLSSVNLTATASNSSSSNTSSEAATTAAASGTCKCGIKEINRIIGGSEATENEYPWIAIFAESDGSSQGGCSSTLIANNWVLTAAHCVHRHGSIIFASSRTVVLGIHDRTSTSESLRKVLKISEIIVHPSYNSGRNPNDIALLKLTESVDLTTYTPACLPAQGTDYSGQKGWVYGWGVTTEGAQQLAQKLQELEIPIVSDSVCSTAMSSVGATITTDMLCAGGMEGKDGCQGDSGGPFTVDVSGQHTLAGAVSWGIGCGRDGLYGVYAEVAQFRDWIDSTIAANGGATFCTG